MEEVDSFLKHKYETNRSRKMSSESKASILRRLVESVKNISLAQAASYPCETFYNSATDSHSSKYKHAILHGMTCRIISTRA